MERRNTSFSRCLAYLLVSTVLLLAGCVSSPEEDLIRGTFVDAGKIKGLEYRSGLRRGITDTDGRFYFVEGDTVEFYIGDVRIGNAATAEAGASALLLVDEDKSYVTNDSVLNISRFFQSIDADNDNQNGIEISENVANEVSGTVLDFDRSAEEFETDPVIIDLFARLGRVLKSAESAQFPLTRGLIDNGVRIPAVMINLGDGWTGGAQSGLYNMNEYTQINAYAEWLNIELDIAFDLEWGNTLLEKNDDGTLTRTSTSTPYNLGVAGATVNSLLNEKTGTGNDLLDEILRYIPEEAGTQIGQIEAAEYLSESMHPERLKFITLDVGKEDTIVAATTELGTRLDAATVNAFLADTQSGHDLDSITENLGIIIQRLAAISDAYIFVANIPYVNHVGAIFNEYDIEAHAVPADADVTVLPDGAHLGMSAFLSLETDLGENSDNTALNSRIAELMAIGGNMLAEETVGVINSRVDAVNDLIASLADLHTNVYVVDLNTLFTEIVDREKSITTDEDTYEMSKMHGGGIFSMDGYNPSNTGYAYISNKFVETLNSTELETAIEETDLASIWTVDLAYRDLDGDEYIAGPDNVTDDAEYTIMDSAYDTFVDCNDYDSGTLAPMLDGSDSCE